MTPEGEAAYELIQSLAIDLLDKIDRIADVFTTTCESGTAGRQMDHPSLGDTAKAQEILAKMGNLLFFANSY